MSSCSSRALTLLSSVFGACGLLLVGIAVSTDHWLYMEEGVVLPQNQSTEVRMALHAGLWRVCFFAGMGHGGGGGVGGGGHLEERGQGGGRKRLG